MSEERQTKRVRVDELDVDDGASLGDLRDRVLALCGEHGEAATLDDSEGRYICFSVMVVRPETDSEMQYRIADQKRRSLSVEERERAELARLVIKYGAVVS